MEGLEGFAQDQLRLYAEFGITAEKAQVLEFEAGNVALSFVRSSSIRSASVLRRASSSEV